MIFIMKTKNGVCQGVSPSIDEFFANTLVLPCDTLTAQHYGQIKLMLRSRSIPKMIFG